MSRNTNSTKTRLSSRSLNIVSVIVGLFLVGGAVVCFLGGYAIMNGDNPALDAESGGATAGAFYLGVFIWIIGAAALGIVGYYGLKDSTLFMRPILARRRRQKTRLHNADIAERREWVTPSR